MLLSAVILPLLATAVVYLLLLWRRQRALFKGLPQPPGHDFIFGHAKVIKELADEMPPGIHPATYGYLLMEKYNLPKAFYVDLWPFSTPWLVVNDTELAEQLTTKPSITKFIELKGMMKPYAGTRNLVVMEGDEWKRWRAIFNSAFSAANLAKHVPAIVAETEKLNDYLSLKAGTGDVFAIEPKAVDLTIEIIGNVILGNAFTSTPLGKSYTAGLRNQLYWTSLGQSPGFGALRQLDPYRRYKMWSNERQMNTAIREIIQQRWAERHQNATNQPTQKALYAIDLALDAYAASRQELGLDLTTIDATYMSTLQDQMKIFLFAGHDTSSGTICYTLWTLHHHPHWLSALRAEYARVFGHSSSNPAATTIATSPHLVNDLPLTTAVIKETLRLYPPASTIRGSTSPYPITDPATGATFETRGCMVWPAAFGIMRDPRYFPLPHAFRPERFLKDRPSELEPERAHAHAWRPFEVGPRNCIGQELAMIEVRVALVLMLGRFDVVPSYGDEGEGDGRWDYLGGQAYPVLYGTAKPNRGMPVRVVERKEE